MMEAMIFLHLIETLALGWLVIRDARTVKSMTLIKTDHVEFLARLAQLESDAVTADCIRDISAVLYSIEKKLDKFIEAGTK